MAGLEALASSPDEASKILNDALQQMDDLVRGDGLDYKSGIQQQIRHHAEELRRLLDMYPQEDASLSDVPHNTVLYLRDYFNRSKCMSNGHLDSAADPVNGAGYRGEEFHKIRHRAATDPENSLSQEDVVLLRAELEANTARVLDLEQQLLKSTEKLMKAEEWLQQEQMNKTYFEAQKLGLMGDIAELRTRLQSVEKERSEYRDKHEKVQKQLHELSQSVQRKDRELAELRGMLSKGGSPFLHNGPSGPENGLATETEVEKLKSAVERLMSENEMKEHKLDELRKAVHKYQKVEEIILQSSAHSSGMRTLSDGDNGSLSSMNDAASSKVFHPSHKASSMGLRNDVSSSFLTSGATAAGQSYSDAENGRSGFATLASGPHAPRLLPAAPAIVHRSNSCEALKYNRVTPKSAATESAPPESWARGNHGSSADSTAPLTAFNSLPRDYRNKLNVGGGGGSAHAGTRKDTYDEETSGDDDAGPVKDTQKKRNSNHGLKKIFSRLKRSSSSEVVDAGGFRRGGARATAGPRLGGWSATSREGMGGQTLLREDPGVPFGRWDGNQVASWLHDLGLAMYMPDCRRWVRCGQQLLDASPHAIEKELRMTNALHRKKLLLALSGVRSSNDECHRADDGSIADVAKLPGAQLAPSALNLRPEWVTRWLDDVGLPQYKDQFLYACIDGRVLNFLTVEDLLSMKIVNALHHASIRRGIEVLRQNDFNLSCLKRRPLPEELADSAAGPSSDTVMLWTNHRIMEWLRTIDLSEYAPNLRGSGVHGGLMMLEPRFTVEILADLLSIPAAKTLLRRHLASHFAALIGEEAEKKKTDAENSPGVLPLTLNGKVKVKKSALFHRRAQSPLLPGVVDGELLCPVDDLTPTGGIKKEDKKVKDAVAAYKKLTKQDQKKQRVENGLMGTSQSPAAKC